MTWLQQSLHKPRLEKLAVALASAMPVHGVASFYNRYGNPSIEWLADQYQSKKSGARMATGKIVAHSYAGQALIPAYRMPDVGQLGVFVGGVRAAAMISSQYPRPILFGGVGRIEQVQDQDVVMFNDAGVNYTWWRRSDIDAQRHNRGDVTRRFMASLSQKTQCLEVSDREVGLLAIDELMSNVLAISEEVLYDFTQIRHDMAGLATIKDVVK